MSRSIISADQKLPPLKATSFAFQHLILIFGAYLTPVIVTQAASLSKDEAFYSLFVALLAGTIASFIQIKRIGSIGSGYLLLMCCSGAFIPVNIEAAKVGGMALVATMTILSSPLELIYAWFTDKIKGSLSPTLAGVTVMLVGITLIPIGMNLWHGFAQSNSENASLNVLIGGATLLSTIFFMTRKRDIRLYAPILGIITGSILSHILMGSHFIDRSLPLVGLPRGNWPGIADLQLQHFPLLGAFLLATLASSIETFGDSIAIQRVSNKETSPIDYKRVKGALLADSIGSAISGLMGGVANTTGSGNIAAVAITGVASRQVGFITCAMTGALAFSPFLSGIILSIPAPVLGGITIVLAATLISTGLDILKIHKLSSYERLIVGVAVTTGIISASGMFFPELSHSYIKPFTDNAIATGGTSAILMTLAGRKKDQEA